MSCCSPDRDAGDGAAVPPTSEPGTRGALAAGAVGRSAVVVDVPGGEFVMGDDSPWSYPGDGEGPTRSVQVSPFGLDATAVTNAEFAAFVEATGHVTDAERFGWSFVFAGFLPDDFEPTSGVVGAEWWRQVFGATWARPEGPHSVIDDRPDHPVVHVSWADASAFAAWAGQRLPTEAEWERAARAGSSTTFPWGDELEEGGRHHANVFQGAFPNRNTSADGWAGTCPVDAFEPNAFGLSNMIGNVWEWTADGWSAQRFHRSPPGVLVDPAVRPRDDTRTLKGGSYLCHHSYCRRYRPAARMRSTVDSSAGNVGFRCAVGGPVAGSTEAGGES